MFRKHFKELPDPPQCGKVMVPLDQALPLRLMAAPAGAKKPSCTSPAAAKANWRSCAGSRRPASERRLRHQRAYSPQPDLKSQKQGVTAFAAQGRRMARFPRRANRLISRSPGRSARKNILLDLITRYRYPYSKAAENG